MMGVEARQSAKESGSFRSECRRRLIGGLVGWYAGWWVGGLVDKNANLGTVLNNFTNGS